MSDLETEKSAERIAKKERKLSDDDDDDKVFDVLNKFKNNMKVEMSNLDKMVTDKKITEALN